MVCTVTYFIYSFFFTAATISQLCEEIWLSENLLSFQASGIASRLKPLFDRVLIMKAEKVTTTKGGIMLPEKSVGKVLEGIVVAIGPGARDKVSISKS